jgi:3-hydroxyisobutyrate dehydrogenase
MSSLMRKGLSNIIKVNYNNIRSISSTKLNQTSVGFIGLGNMGFNMASNLQAAVKSGKLDGSIQVYDISPDSVNKMLALGAKASPTVESLAASSDIIVTMVPATAHVISVLRGDSGCFKHAKKNTLIIDCSTIDPIVSKELSIEAANMGLRMIDAPVSGGVGGATAGTLTFMVGATEDNLKAATPVLNCMGTKIVLCGDAGSGGVTKLCNNLALAIQMIGTSEALTLGKRLGMDAAKLSEVMGTSTARCWSLDTYNPSPGVMSNVPSSRDFEGGFGSALMKKDIGLALAAGKEVNAQLPLGVLSESIYDTICNDGFANKDFGYVHEHLLKDKK